VPEGSVAVLRWDVEQAVLYEPLRRHLLPVIDARLASSGRAATEPDGLRRLEAATKINLGRDLREVVVARGPRPDDWVLAAGGMFATSGVVEGLAALLREQGQPWQLTADHRTAQGPGGLALGQATDGVVLLASSRGRLEAALAPSRQSERLGLVTGHGGALALDLSAGGTGVVTGMRGVLLLGNPVEIDLVADLAPGASRQRAPREISELVAAAGLRGADRRVLQVPAQLSVTDLGPDQVTVRFPWERAEIDASAQEIAKRVGEAWPPTAGSRVE
jgi:hypothetical protein